MKLKTLFADLEVSFKGAKDTAITGLCNDSRVLSPGQLFLAKKGSASNGAQFIEKAISAGASAILTDIYDPFLKCPQIIHPNPASLEALLAARFFGNPSKKLCVIGVTGTKGKTTTSYLIHHLIPSGLASTVETIIQDTRHDSTLTTHDVITNQKLLKEMLLKKLNTAVLEVSSHGLAQGRVDCIDFEMGVFTNLYPDHLDYHKTMDAYAEAKKLLFTKAKRSILNADCPYSERMGKGVSFGIRKGDIRAENIRYLPQGTQFTVHGVEFLLPLIGEFNVYNAMAAITVSLELGNSLKSMQQKLATFTGAPGRMQRIGNVFVDFAHTGEALEMALRSLRQICKGKLIVVFGAGGDRDPMRRFSLGKAASLHADLSIVTTDNPRSEDPAQIADAIVSCFEAKPIVELDREKAIAKALSLANAEDFVLVAGRGHERVQIVGARRIPLSDAAIVKQLLTPNFNPFLPQ